MPAPPSAKQRGSEVSISCEHGLLRRQCALCDAIQEARELRARIAELEAQAAQQRTGVPDVDALAAFIRKVDGSHRMGAGALAERICDWWSFDAVAVAPTPKAQQQAPQPAEVGADERAKFEAWITSPPLEKPVHRNPESSGFPGQYWEYEVQLAWDAWQARAQLTEGADATSDLHEYIAGMRAALRSGDWRKASTRAELESFLGRMEEALTAAGGREELATERDELYAALSSCEEEGQRMQALLTRIVAEADSNPFNPIGHVIEHVVPETRKIAATQPAQEVHHD